jgi:hypothetical protein
VSLICKVTAQAYPGRALFVGDAFSIAEYSDFIVCFFMNKHHPAAYFPGARKMKFPSAYRSIKISCFLKWHYMRRKNGIKFPNLKNCGIKYPTEKSGIPPSSQDLLKNKIPPQGKPGAGSLSGSEESNSSALAVL